MDTRSSSGELGWRCCCARWEPSQPRHRTNGARKLSKNRSSQPLLEMLGYKDVVVQVGIGCINTLDFLGSQLQQRRKQSHRRVANGKLRGVNTNGQTARPRRQIIAPQRTLSALIQLALGI